MRQSLSWRILHKNCQFSLLYTLLQVPAVHDIGEPRGGGRQSRLGRRVRAPLAAARPLAAALQWLPRVAAFAEVQGGRVRSPGAVRAVRPVRLPLRALRPPLPGALHAVAEPPPRAVRCLLWRRPQHAAARLVQAHQPTVQHRSRLLQARTVAPIAAGNISRHHYHQCRTSF